jgi:hypothetical protein
MPIIQAIADNPEFRQIVVTCMPILSWAFKKSAPARW